MLTNTPGSVALYAPWMGVSGCHKERERGWGVYTWDLDCRWGSGTTTGDGDLGASNVELGTALAAGAMERDNFRSQKLA